MARDLLERRTAVWFRTIGRLKPGVTDDQADSELTYLFQQLKAEEISAGTGSLISHSTPSDYRVQIERGSRGLNVLRGRFQQPLGLLMAVVALVLLITCCNVANLLLARGAARRRETGIRLALGCSRRRLVAQMLTESVLASLAGGALGLLLAGWTADFLVVQFSIGALDLHLDARVLAFTLAISLGTALLFGLAPALRATAVDVGPALQTSSARQSGSRTRRRASKVLVMVQVALSLWLLIGAALLVRSLRNLRDLDIGVDRRHILTLNVVADPTEVRNAQPLELRRRLVEGFTRIPGVTSVSFSAFVCSPARSTPPRFGLQDPL